MKEQEIKNGRPTFLAAEDENQELERVKGVWKTIFNYEYETTPPKAIHYFAVGVAERMHLIKKFMPFSLPSILKFIFLHPNAKNSDKEVNKLTFF
jgi:hypothetical protein